MKDYKEFLRTHNVMETGEIIAYARTIKYKRLGKTFIKQLKERKLKTKKTKAGKYPRIWFKNKIFKVHQVMAEKFLPPSKIKTEINHKDGNKENNHISNLERVTRSENVKHAYQTGLIKIEKGRTKRKLTENDVKQIRKNYIDSNNVLSSKFNVSSRTIGRVKNNVLYKNVL